MTTDEKLDLILQRLDGVDHRLDRVDHRLDGVDQRLDRMDQRLEATESQGAENRDLLDRIERRLDTHLTKIQDLEVSIKAYQKNFNDGLHGLTVWMIEMRDRLNTMTH